MHYALNSEVDQNFAVATDFVVKFSENRMSGLAAGST